MVDIASPNKLFMSTLWWVSNTLFNCSFVWMRVKGCISKTNVSEIEGHNLLNVVYIVGLIKALLEKSKNSVHAV